MILFKIKKIRFYLLLTAALSFYHGSLSADNVAVSEAKPIDTSLAQGILRQFTVADFKQYAPQNALDIVNRIAGFALAEEDKQRGLGQASSNILVNGTRIAGKSNGIITTLQRIPVASIVAIDIYEGASLGIPGLSGEVVDVVVKSNTFAGNWRWELQHRDEHDEVDPAYWKANISMAGSVGTTSWNLGLDNDYQRLGFGGPETLYDASDNEIESRDEYGLFDRDKATLSLGLAFEPDSGNTGHVNLAYQQFWQGDLETRDSNLAGRDQRFERADNEWSAEVSGDYRFPIADGQLKLIGFQSVKRLPAKSIRVGIDNPETDRSESRRTDKTDESILRSEFDWLGEHNSSWQWAFESAYNSFDRHFVARNTGALAFGSSGLDLQNVRAKVEELRFETNLSYSRPLTAKLSMQSSIGIENSNLEQSGDQQQERNFTRPKGLLALAYQYSSATNISIKLERIVDQLEFTDFIASADLNTGETNAGNPDLVPPQLWRAELSIDQSFKQWGALSVKLIAEDIEDIVDRIPVANGDAAGNLAGAKRYGLELTSALEFTPMGWRGARLEIDAIFNRSELDDPITGESRRINNELIHDVTFELRHDIPDTFWAWGLSYRLERNAPTFRLNQVSELRQNRGLAFPFIEHKNVFGLTARFKIRNFDDRTDTLERKFYTPRRDGVFVGRESRDRDFGKIYFLELFGSF